MSTDIIVPLTLPQDCLKWKTPQDEIDYWRAHPETEMPYIMWNRYYCSSIQHRGFCCSGCLSDEEYNNMPNFDDKCCCLAAIRGEIHE